MSDPHHPCVYYATHFISCLVCSLVIDQPFRCQPPIPPLLLLPFRLVVPPPVDRQLLSCATRGASHVFPVLSNPRYCCYNCASLVSCFACIQIAIYHHAPALLHYRHYNSFVRSPRSFLTFHQLAVSGKTLLLIKFDITND